MRLVLTGKAGLHKKSVDILPKFDMQNAFIPVTAGQLFNTKLPACKIFQQEIFGDIINKMKKTGADYLTAFRKTVHDPKLGNMLASIAGFRPFLSTDAMVYSLSEDV